VIGAVGTRERAAPTHEKNLTGSGIADPLSPDIPVRKGILVEIFHKRATGVSLDTIAPLYPEIAYPFRLLHAFQLLNKLKRWPFALTYAESVEGVFKAGFTVKSHLSATGKEENSGEALLDVRGDSYNKPVFGVNCGKTDQMRMKLFDAGVYLLLTIPSGQIQESSLMTMRLEPGGDIRNTKLHLLIAG
jgi:hypothetical protein